MSKQSIERRPVDKDCHAASVAMAETFGGWPVGGTGPWARQVCTYMHDDIEPGDEMFWVYCQWSMFR